MGSVLNWMFALLSAAVVLAAHGAPASATHVPTIAAVGDVACAPGDRTTATTCHQQQVADAIARTSPDSLWLLGDSQYMDGSLDKFRSSFGPAFDRFSSRWHPIPGNHEYATPGAAGYYDYFGRAAGPARRGYYSFNLGRWHVVALNSNCEPASCGPDSPQAKWLKADLRRNPRVCTAALWHHPRYSSSAGHGDDPRSKAIWRILQARRAELMLSGHDHDFEVFRRQNAYSRADRTGLQQFVVGTGGKASYPFGAVRPNSVVRRTDTFGFLSIRLRARSYSWSFIDESGSKLASGASRCMRDRARRY